MDLFGAAKLIPEFCACSRKIQVIRREQGLFVNCILFANPFLFLHQSRQELRHKNQDHTGADLCGDSREQGGED